ncbi:MAG: DNA polymerase thumb domain-containing protein [Gemmataceae bacterium]
MSNAQDVSEERPGGWVLHLDVDAFFAAVEQRDQPGLRGKPIAVGTGVVASCSYESRPWGVRTGMRLMDARRCCGHLIVLPGDYRRYQIASRQILGICHEMTPRVEMAALDDLYLDLTGMSWSQAWEMAESLGRKIEEEVGLKVSLGLGTNKLVAGVATQEVKDRKAGEPDRAKWRNLAGVLPGEEPNYLAGWPVEILPGVGHKAQEQLAALNVRRVEQLAAMPLSLLIQLFGSQGGSLRDLARGIDPRPVRPSRPALSISRCTSLDPAMGNPSRLLAMLDHLVERAILPLRENSRATRRVQVRLGYSDFQWVQGGTTLSRPSDEEEVLKAAARDRFKRLFTRRVPLRLIGVELVSLTSTQVQTELFADPSNERKQRLRSCKDEIRRRFGFMSLRGGTSLELMGLLEHDRDNFSLRTPCLTR